MENVASLAVLLAFCVAIYALLASVVDRLKHKPFLMVSGERAVYSVWLLISVAFGDSTKIAKTILRVLICYLQRKWVLLGAILTRESRSHGGYQTGVATQRARTRPAPPVGHPQV
jgi:hypothetical protein